MAMDDFWCQLMHSNQLLYLLYGDKSVYRHEAKFSILSALRYRTDPSRFVITVMTDQPEEFKGWPVKVIALDQATLSSWVGDTNYHHRRKACAIQAGVKLAKKTVFIDTDTVFLKDPSELFKRVNDDQFLMDEFEWSWEEGAQRREYKTLVGELAERNASPAPSLKLYNSGICGMTLGNASMMDGVVNLIDQWAHHGKRLMTIEQIAVSFMLDGKKVVEANDCVNHYFSLKRFHHAMIKVFFENHGEGYRAELIRLAASVPSVLPKPSTARRLQMLWRLKGQNKVGRKVAKFYLLGRQSHSCVYLAACNPIWWEKAVEEMRAGAVEQPEIAGVNTLWLADPDFTKFAKAMT